MVEGVSDEQFSISATAIASRTASTWAGESHAFSRYDSTSPSRGFITIVPEIGNTGDGIRFMLSKPQATNVP